MKRWIVVANSSYAEFFECNGKEIIRVKAVDFPNGRLKGSEILSDRPGRGFDRMGSGLRHALSSEVDPHQHEQQIFARIVADLIKKGALRKLFNDLVLVMPPEFLGLVRPLLSDHIKRSLTHEFKKDIPEALSDQEKFGILHKLLEMEKGSGLSPWQKEYQKGAH